MFYQFKGQVLARTVGEQTALVKEKTGKAHTFNQREITKWKLSNDGFSSCFPLMKNQYVAAARTNCTMKYLDLNWNKKQNP